MRLDLSGSASRHGAEVAAVRDENYEQAVGGHRRVRRPEARVRLPLRGVPPDPPRVRPDGCRALPDDETVTKGACDAWLSLVADEHPNELMRRVSPVRQLAKYMAAAGKPSYVIPPGIPGKRLKYQAHIFTREELSAFFAAIDSCGPSACSPTKAYVVPTLFRMLYCCGMRSSEALLLGASGVDLEAGRIDVKGCKGWRGRTVYMGDDMLRVCRAYDAVIEGMLPGRVPFFPNREGGFFSRRAESLVPSVLGPAPRGGARQGQSAPRPRLPAYSRCDQAQQVGRGGGGRRGDVPLPQRIPRPYQLRRHELLPEDVGLVLPRARQAHGPGQLARSPGGGAP